MRNYPKALKRKLLNTICQMREELPKYTTDPKRDFTRNRKLPFETLCRTILSMSGQSLNVELQRQFYYDPTAATTPVAANTKQNNPKSFAKNKFDPANHPKDDLDCALGVHSASNQHNERRYEFYWGYKNHMLVDCISGLPLYELTTPANAADSTVVQQILAAANNTLPLRECTFLGDKGYDVKSVYHLVKDVYDGEAFIPLNKRNTKYPKKLSAGNPICDAGLAMHKDGKTSDGHGGLRQKFCCPFRQSKTGCCPCNHKKLEQRQEKPGLHKIQDHSR